MAPLADVFVRVRVDKRAAERELREFNRNLRELPNVVDVNVDLDIGKALAEIAVLKRELASLKRDLNQQGGVKFATRIDTEGMQRMGAAIGRVTVGIPALVGAAGLAAGAVASLGAGFVALGSAVAPAAGAIAALPALLGAAAQGAGVAAAGFFGIGDAVKAMFTLDKSAALTAQTMAAARVASAERIRRANITLQDAERSQQRTAISGGRAVQEAMQAIADARVQAAQSIKSAEQGVADARIAAGERTKAAEERLSDAQRSSRAAQEDLNRARKDAKQQLEDLNTTLKDSALNEEDAQLGLERAQQRLADLRSKGAKVDSLDLREADLNVRQAAQRLVEVKERHKDLKVEVADANKQGVEGADNVVKAREKVASAHRDEAKAAQGVRDAQVEGARDIAKAQATLQQAQVAGARAVQQAQVAAADAQAQASQANADAARNVAEAQAGLADAMQKTELRMAKQSSQAFGLAYAMSQISPKARIFAKYLHDDLIPALVGIQFKIQDTFLPQFQTALQTLTPLLPMISGHLVDTADALGQLAVKGAEAMASGPFARDLDTLMANNTQLISVYGRTIGNLGSAFMDVAVAAIPLANHIADFAEALSKSISKFTAAQRASGGLNAFFELTWDVLKRLGRITGNLLGVLWNVGKAGQDAGRLLLDAFEGATKKWKDFTGSIKGQSELKDYFANSAQSVLAVSRLIGHISSGFARLGADKNIPTLIKSIDDKLVPAFGRLFDSVSGDLGQQLIDFATDLVNMIGALTKDGGGLTAFVGTLDSLTKSVTALLNSPAGPGVSLFLKAMGAIAASMFVFGIVGRYVAALGKFFLVLKGGGKAVGGAAKGLGLFGRGLSWFRRGGPIDGAALRFMYAKDAIVKFGKGVANVFGRGGLMDGVRLRIMYAKDAIGRFGGSVARLFRGGGVIDTIRLRLMYARDALSRFGTKLFDAGKAVGRFAGSALSRAGGVLSRLAGSLGSVGKAVGRFAGSALGRAGRLLGTFGRAGLALGKALGGRFVSILRIAALAVRGFMLALVSNPVGLIIAGLVLLGIALFVAYKKSETFRNIVNKAFAKVKEAATAVVNYFKDHWPQIKAVLEKVFEGIKAYIKVWLKVWGTIISAIGHVISWVVDHWPAIKDHLLHPISAFKSDVGAIWDKIFGIAKGFVNGTKEWIKKHWGLVLGILTGPIGLAIYEIQKHWDSIKTAAHNFITNLKDWFVSHWKLIAILGGPVFAVIAVVAAHWDKIKTTAHDFVTNLKQWVVDHWTSIKEKLSTPISDAKDKVVGFFKDMYDKSKQKLDDLITRVKEIPGRAKDGLSTLGNMMKQGIGSGLKAVFDFIDGTLIGNLNKITTKFGVEIPRINWDGKFAKGGVVPGYRPGVDNFAALLSPGEGILTPQTTRAIGGEATIKRLNALGHNADEAFGGAWDKVKSAGSAAKHGIAVAGSATAHAAGAAVDFGKDVAGNIEENLQKGYQFALEHLMNPFIDRFDSAFGGNTFGAFTTGVLRKMRDAASGKAHDADNAQEASGAPGDLGAGIAGLVGGIADRIAGGVAFPLPRGSYRVGMPPFGYAGHKGQDFPAPIGTPVFSPIGGLFVRRVLTNPDGSYKSFGNMGNVFGANGLQFIAGHMSSFARGNGLVRPGERIGSVGSTGHSSGPHLHAEFRRFGSYVNPRTILPAYDTGGILGHNQIGINRSGKPERVLSGRQTETFERMVKAMERQGSGGSGGRSMVVNVSVSPKQRRLGWEVGDAVANTAFLNGWV